MHAKTISAAYVHRRQMQHACKGRESGMLAKLYVRHACTGHNCCIQSNGSCMHVRTGWQRPARPRRCRSLARLVQAACSVETLV